MPADHADSIGHPSPPRKPKVTPTEIGTFSELESKLPNLSDEDVTAVEASLLETEHEEIERHISDSEYRIGILRLNALFETYVEFLLVVEQERSKNGLSTSKRKEIEDAGHRNRLDMAKDDSILGEHVKGALSALQTARNDPAHVAWTDVSPSDVESELRHAYDKLGDHIRHLRTDHLKSP